MVQQPEPGQKPEKKVEKITAQPVSNHKIKGDAGPYGEIQSHNTQPCKIPKKESPEKKDSNIQSPKIPKITDKKKTIVIKSMVTVPKTSALYKISKKVPIRHEKELAIPLGK